MSERKNSCRAALAVLGVGLAWVALAQAPPAAPAAPAPAAPPAASAPAPGPQAVPPPPDDNMLVEGEALYRHQSERDPFTPLIRGTQSGSDVIVKPGDSGLARFTVESCSLEAIIKAPGGTVAWFQGPDAKPYKAAVGERFADGVVVEVSYENGEVVVQQQLNDPNVVKPYRNLPLKIRNQEGEGQ